MIKKIYVKKCEYCGKEFEGKKNKKTCSNNCRAKLNYHKKTGSTTTYVMNRTKEEKAKIRNEYFKKKYTEDIDFRQYMLEKRRERYKRTGK